MLLHGEYNISYLLLVILSILLYLKFIKYHPRQPSIPTFTKASLPPSHRPLSVLINDFTRSSHSRLNKLVASLLPLALPPHTSSPLLYLYGISHILPIYETLEQTFQELIAQADCQDDVRNEDECGQYADLILKRLWDQIIGVDRKDKDSNEVGNNTHLLMALKHLWLAELARTDRLRSDIKTLKKICSHTPNNNTEQHPQPPHHHSPKLRALLTRLHTTISTNPHLLLASSWLFYMALFSGGRYIRSRLLDAGPDFWTQSIFTSASTPNPDLVGSISIIPQGTEILGLRFWTFPSPNDGEDIKFEFKRRFHEIEALLTAEQVHEIVIESRYIMDETEAVVREAAELIEPLRRERLAPDE